MNCLAKSMVYLLLGVLFWGLKVKGLLMGRLCMLEVLSVTIGEERVRGGEWLEMSQPYMQTNVQADVRLPIHHNTYINLFSFLFLLSLIAIIRAFSGRQEWLPCCSMEIE